MRIKEVAQLSGVSENALRFYEKQGLLRPKRKENGYREYQERDIQNIMMIHLYRTMGFSIVRIKEMFHDSKQQNYMQLFFEHQAFLNQKIKELSIIEKGISTCLNQVFMMEDSQENLWNTLRESQKEIYAISNWKDAWNFDAWAKEYDEIVYSKQSGLAFYKNYDQVLQRCAQIANENAQQILEIGVGSGNLLSKLKADYVVGIDQSIQMLMVTKQKYPTIPIHSGTFLNIPFPNNTFSCVVSSYAFHHNNDVEKRLAIEEMTRVIKHDGNIVICDLMFENQAKRDAFEQQCSSQEKEELEDEYFANVDELSRIFRSMGYMCDVEQIDELIWIVSAKHRNMIQN